MRKLTECLIVLAFLLCAFTTAQAAPDIDVSVPSAGEPCSNDLQCGDGEVCVNDICSAPRPCSNDLQCDEGEVCVNDICVPSTSQPCTSDLSCGPGELCIDDICKEAECQNDEDCEEGLICASNKCVECATWTDCGEGEICSDENTCVLADDCDLQIKPKKIKINKDRKTTYKAFKLKVKGNENFYPFRIDPVTGEPVLNPSNGRPFRDMTLTPFGIKAIRYRWYQKSRVLEEVLGVNTDQESGFYTIRLGKCLAEVEVQSK